MTETPDASRLYERPLARAHALAETWDGDHTAITRHQAAALLYEVLATTGWTQTEPPTAHLAAVPDEPDFGIEGCTCKPFTHQGGTRYLDQPGDTVDMIGGWEINDCPHHKRRAAAPAVGEQPHA